MDATTDLIATTIAVLFGSGSLTALVYAGLVYRLDNRFASQDVEEDVENNASVIADNRADIRELRAIEDQRWQEVARHVIEPLGRITDRLEDMDRRQMTTEHKVDDILDKIDAQ